MASLPKQKVSRGSKTEEWHINSMKHYISNSTVEGGLRANLRELYRFYNGEIQQGDYSYITNPYNAPQSKRQGWPARIRNYNIIKPVVDMLMGEKRLQSNNYTVVAVNGDAVNSYEDKKRDMIMQNLQQMFINELNQLGVQTGVPDAPVMTSDEIEAYMQTSYKDLRAITGQQVLDYLSNYLELEEKWLDAFFHYLVTGEVYTFKEPYRDDMEYDVVNPLDIDYHRSPDVKYVEDAQWVVRRKWMARNDVIDRFREELSSAQVSQLEEHTGPGGDSAFYQEYFAPIYQRRRGSKDTLIEVVHVVWKSFKKVGIVTEYAEDGEVLYEIAEGMDKPEGADVRWEWITEVREGYRIDGDIFVGMDALPYDRAEMNNSSAQKLPYNGTVFNHVNSYNVSVASIGKPYQILYNFLHYKFELSIAKNKDSIVLMDINAIPNKPGWDEDKFMYYTDAMGFMFVDGSSPSSRGFNQFSILNSTLGDYVARIHELLMAIKSEYEETLGINRQRKGQQYASDGKSVTEAALARSSVITADLFRKFENFQRREAQGLLDISKFAYAGGKKAMFVNSDLRLQTLNVDPDVFMEADLSIFARNASEERDKLDTLKQMSFQFAQNKVGPATIAEILDSDNFANIKSKLKELEIAEQKLAQQAGEQEAQAAQNKEMMKVQAEEISKQRDRDHESYENQLDRDHEVNLELLKMGSGEAIFDANAAEQNSIQRENNMLQANLKAQELNVKREEIAQKDRERQTKKEIEDKKAETALKNKTAGEK